MPFFSKGAISPLRTSNARPYILYDKSMGKDTNIK